MTTQKVVVGVFDDRAAVVSSLEALRQVGFEKEQLGFVQRHKRTNAQDENAAETGAASVTRGIVGGILGAADILLVPITGPADASAMLAGTLPAVEEAIDKLFHRRPHQDYAGTELHGQGEQKERENQTSTTTDQLSVEAIEAHEQTSIVTSRVVGGVLGAAAAILLPGIGPAVAGGILVTILGGAMVGGVVGSFLSAFAGLGVPEEKARYYEEEVKAGRIIVTIQIKSSEQEHTALDILRQHHAHDVQAHEGV